MPYCYRSGPEPEEGRDSFHFFLLATGAWDILAFVERVEKSLKPLFTIRTLKLINWHFTLVHCLSSGQGDSNPWHSAWEADILPTELYPLYQVIPLLNSAPMHQEYWSSDKYKRVKIQ